MRSQVINFDGVPDRKQRNSPEGWGGLPLLVNFEFEQTNGDTGRFQADCFSVPRVGEVVARADEILFEVVRVVHVFVDGGKGPPIQNVNVSLEEFEIVDDEDAE